MCSICVPELTVAKDAVAAPNPLRASGNAIYSCTVPVQAGQTCMKYPHPPGVDDVRTCRVECVRHIRMGRGRVAGGAW
jgi:hypothetical protein